MVSLLAVTLTTSSGSSDTFKSADKAVIFEIVEALNDAIISRG